MPSSVTEERSTRWRNSSFEDRRSAASRSYSRSIDASGLTKTTPATPSTISRSPVLIFPAAEATPATAGVPSERARIELWENLLPLSVTNARTLSSSRRAVTEGRSSSETTIAPSGTLGPSRVPCWARAESNRFRTSWMSAVRARKFPSGAVSSLLVYSSKTFDRAASTLMRCSAAERSTCSRRKVSPRTSLCAAKMSAWLGPMFSRTSSCKASSSASARATAASKRARSPSNSDARTLRFGTVDRKPSATTYAVPCATPADTPIPLSMTILDARGRRTFRSTGATSRQSASFRQLLRPVLPETAAPPAEQATHLRSVPTPVDQNPQPSCGSGARYR